MEADVGVGGPGRRVAQRRRLPVAGVGGVGDVPASAPATCRPGPRPGDRPSGDHQKPAGAAHLLGRDELGRAPATRRVVLAGHQPVAAAAPARRPDAAQLAARPRRRRRPPSAPAGGRSTRPAPRGARHVATGEVGDEQLAAEREAGPPAGGVERVGDDPPGRLPGPLPPAAPPPRAGRPGSASSTAGSPTRRSSARSTSNTQRQVTGSVRHRGSAGTRPGSRQRRR